MLTPFDFHSGNFETIIEKRDSVLKNAYELKPERFVNGKPKVKRPDNKVWINKPNNSIVLINNSAKNVA
jgi:hypothetical protein